MEYVTLLKNKLTNVLSINLFMLVKFVILNYLLIIKHIVMKLKIMMKIVFYIHILYHVENVKMVLKKMKIIL